MLSMRSAVISRSTTEDDGAEWAMEEEANLIMETIKRYFGTWARLFSEEQARRSSAQMGAV